MESRIGGPAQAMGGDPMGVPGQCGGSFAVTLRPVPQSVKHARELLRFAFTQWGLIDLVYEGTLVISELTSNAIRHSPANSPVVDRLFLAKEAGPVIEVWDADPELPALCVPAEPLAECGWGLHVVANLATNLAVFPSPWGSGKIVQAVMRTN
jgi:anti-sigma regulatory factor (Ser/Thr protein kinase)